MEIILVVVCGGFSIMRYIGRGFEGDDGMLKYAKERV